MSRTDDLKEMLPLPSTVVAEVLCIPHWTGEERWCPDRKMMVPVFGAVYFEKEYHNGICIGWKRRDKEISEAK